MPFEVITLEACKSETSHGYLMNFFAQMFHRIVHNLVKMIFNLRGHLMPEKKLLKIDLFDRKF